MMTDDFLSDVDILTSMNRAQEQSEAAAGAMASICAAIFNSLIGEGLTRDEALTLTPFILGRMMDVANGGE